MQDLQDAMQERWPDRHSWSVDASEGLDGVVPFVMVGARIDKP